MPAINLEDQIKRLVELQKIDFDIYNRKIELEDIPDRLKELDSLIKEKEGIFKSSEEKTKSLQLKRKDKEIELGTKEESIKKQTAQLYQVKTNQEYNTLQKEINSQKADKGVLEEEILMLFDDIEKAEKELAANKNLFQAEKAKIEQEKKLLNEKKLSLESELGNLKAQREQFSKDVDKDILTKYERILAARDGKALVKVEADACGGCNMNLPPQVINEVKLKKDLVICGNCSRILYTEE